MIFRNGTRPLRPADSIRPDACSHTGPSHGTGLADALMAATAEASGADLVAFNRRHFPMVEVTVPYERK